EIGRAYHKLNFGDLPHGAPAGEVARGGGTQIADAWFENATGERVTSASQEEPLSMCFEARLGEALEDPVLAATLRTELGHTIVVARSDQHGAGTGAFAAGEGIVARFAIPNWLTPSRYTLTPSIARAGTGEEALALVEDMAEIVVHGSGSGGILELPVDVRINRL
ncbi:MAG TPA: Wzt carbohydrate-binding domain-containing protein, partial [Solirubrobacteraceae bacterium]|nr:Wzt carbohydrate-binding domain-containing protein [Solirubrobacteraceae bacterium]